MVQYVLQLERLEVSYCEEIEEIVQGGAFPDMAQLKWIKLTLEELPKLRTICRQQLVLEDIKLIDCPMLKKLPILCSDIQQISGEIIGAREWWEGMEWENEHSMTIYSAIYKEVDVEYDKETSEGEVEVEYDEEASEGEGEDEDEDEVEYDEEASEGEGEDEEEVEYDEEASEGEGEGEGEDEVEVEYDEEASESEGEGEDEVEVEYDEEASEGEGEREVEVECEEASEGEQVDEVEAADL